LKQRLRTWYRLAAKSLAVVLLLNLAVMNMLGATLPKWLLVIAITAAVVFSLALLPSPRPRSDRRVATLRLRTADAYLSALDRAQASLFRPRNGADDISS
jgi:hypothetical protein